VREAGEIPEQGRVAVLTGRLAEQVDGDEAFPLPAEGREAYRGQAVIHPDLEHIATETVVGQQLVVRRETR